MNERLNILIVVNTLDKGGRTKRIIQEMLGLRRLNHQVTLAVFEDPPEWVKNRYSDSHEWLILNKRAGKFDLQLLRNIMQTLRSLDINIIHSHCEASALYAGIASKLSQTKIVGTFHRSKLEFYQPTFKNRFSAWLLDHCIAISSERQERMSAQLGISDRKITLIHGGVELQELPEVQSAEALRSMLGVRDKAILSAGHLGPIKGHDDSIQALAILNKSNPTILEAIHLYIAGDGSEEDYLRLKSLINQHELMDKVTLLGQTGNIMEWMLASELFLQPSREEGFGLVFIEAGLCRKPVIATQVGGIPDIVINEQTGFLVEPNKPEQIAEKLSLLLVKPELRQQMGEQAYQRTTEHFLLGKQNQKLEQLYRSL